MNPTDAGTDRVQATGPSGTTPAGPRSRPTRPGRPSPGRTSPGRTSPGHRIRPLRRAFVAAALQPLSEPSSLIGFGVFFVIPPAVLAMVWKVAAEGSGGQIVGYSAGALVWYIAMAETAILTVRNRLIEQIGEDVGSGRIAVEMQRPISVLSMRLASELGFMVPRLIIGMGLAFGVALALGGWPPAPVALVVAVPSLLLALTLNVVGQHLFAAASFWVSEAKGAWFLYNKLVFVLGGMLLPLEVLPTWMEAVAKLLPFMAMAYVPSRLAAGFLEPELILVQLFWLAVLLAGAGWCFGRGERHLMGGGS